MSTGGEEIFKQQRSLIWKSLRVTRVYDAENNALVYLAHARQVQLGSGKMSLSVVPLADKTVTWTKGAPAAKGGAACSWLPDRFGAVHVVCNNAGVGAPSSLAWETTVNDWRWVHGVNVMGVVHGCRAALPHLQRNGSGLIINIASAAAFASAPGMAPYNATKAAVLSISETLAAELSGAGMQAHSGERARPVGTGSSLLEFEVVQQSQASTS